MKTSQKKDIVAPKDTKDTNYGLKIQVILFMRLAQTAYKDNRILHLKIERY